MWRLGCAAVRVEILEGTFAPEAGEAVVDARVASGGPSIRTTQGPLRVELVVALPAWAPGAADYASRMEHLYRTAAAEARAAGATSLVMPALGVEVGGGPPHPVAHAAMRGLRQAHGAGEAPGRVRIVCRDPTVAQVFRDALAANAIVRRPSA